MYGVRHLELLAIAYVLTGVCKVAKTFRQPFRNRPTYVRQRRYGVMALVVVGWIVVDLGMVSQYWRDRSIRAEAISNFLLFAVLSVLSLATM